MKEAECLGIRAGAAPCCPEDRRPDRGGAWRCRQCPQQDKQVSYKHVTYKATSFILFELWYLQHHVQASTA